MLDTKLDTNVGSRTRTIVDALSNSGLWDNYQQLKSEHKMLFPLEGAERLGVSELELVLASPDSQFLGTDCQSVLEKLSDLPRLESIVRNEFAVHEKIGRLDNLKLSPHMGIALNVRGLDLRLFLRQWQYVLSTPSKSADGASVPSIQFFDKQGSAIAKMFLRDEAQSSLDTWQDIINKYVLETKDTANALSAPLPVAQAKSDDWQPKSLGALQRKDFEQKWLAMTDVHQFHRLISEFNLDRASSYRMAPPTMTQQLETTAIEALLTQAKEIAKPIMMFVSNKGIVQIQTGVVHNVKRMGDWINVLDKKETDFTLHLNDKALVQVWCLKRPTKDGIVTAIEGFDQYGNSIITFFGERQEGTPEQAYWQELVADLLATYPITEQASVV